MHFVASSGGTVPNSSVFMTVNEPLPQVATTTATAPLGATRLGDYLELNLTDNGGKAKSADGSTGSLLTMAFFLSAPSRLK